MAKSSSVRRALTMPFAGSNRWIETACLCGLLTGPAVGLTEYAEASAAPVFPAPALGAVGALTVATCFVILYTRAVGPMQGSTTAAGLRTAAVLTVGGALWALPGGWSVPARVLGWPLDWFLLTVPFVLAAVAVAPGVRRRVRVLAVTPLLAVALVWPAVCGMAADEVRHQTGRPVEAWFVAKVDGYSADSYRVRSGGVAEIDFHALGDTFEDFAELALESWPATSASPCGHFEGAQSCTLGDDGRWSVAGEFGSGSTVVEVRGSRWLAVTGTSFTDAQLLDVLLKARIADNHEFLAAVNGF